MIKTHGTTNDTTTSQPRQGWNPEATSTYTSIFNKLHNTPKTGSPTQMNAFTKTILTITTVIALLLPSAIGKTYQADDSDALAQIVPLLQPGDTLTLAAKTWHNLSLKIDAHGTQENPILIQGAANGTTLVTGPSQIEIGGQHITLANFHFKNAEAVEGQNAIVSFKHGGDNYATNSRLTECYFDACNPIIPNRRYAWIRLYGQDNRVDHCRFSGQAHSGVTIQAMMKVANARHSIDHNHFLDRAPGDGNGFECIQLGQSGDSEKDGDCIIENNLFERCDGETEIVSIKTGNNTIRSNTFYQSAGTLTLRHGNGNLVEGNAFIGNGKAGAGGVRLIGTHHTIRNNYFEGISNVTGGLIVLYCGIPDSVLKGYFAAHSATIENNLIYNGYGNGIYLHGGYGEKNRVILPSNVRVANNLIHITFNAGTQIVGTLSDLTLEGNTLAFGQEAGTTHLEGFEKVKLTFPRNSQGLPQPTNADGTPAFTFTQPTPKLLDRNEVGPQWHQIHPDTIVIEPKQLNRLSQVQNPERRERLTATIQKADQLVADGQTYSVTSNDRIPPSGDKRSYYSTGPYWWANPDTDDGLPYVRRDGQFNPERDLVSDRPLLHAMIDDVLTLSIAYNATNQERYAQHASTLLRVWFIDESTRMLPNLQHAQAIPGKSEGRGTGIIDTLVFVELVDALRILQTSYSWPESEKKGIDAWFTTYLEWLTYNSNGIHELNAKNNHGTAYDLQQLAIAAYLNQENLVAHIIQRVKEERIPHQITPEGKQPLEFARTRSWSYCTENIEHFSRIAAIAHKYGESLYTYVAPNGATLTKALEELLTHAADPKSTWPGKQLTKWQSEYIYAATSIAAGLLPNNQYYESLSKIGLPHDTLQSQLMQPITHE